MTEPRPPQRSPGPRQGPGIPSIRGAATGPLAARPDAPLPPYRAALDALDETRPIRLPADAAPVAQARPAPAVRPLRPAPEARSPRVRPDPNPLRMLIGFAGLAAASAITTALLPSILPAPALAATPLGNDAAAVAPAPSVIHVTRTVQLAPGQSAPPNTSVQVQPQPTPQVRIQVVTRQSGKP